jgi:hypothetical protein
MPRLYLQLRGAVWWYRRAVPVELVNIVGKREVLKRLGGNRKSAERQASIETVETDALFGEARRKLSTTTETPTTNELSDATIGELAASWFVEAQGKDEHLTHVDVDERREWLAALADYDGGTISFHETRKLLKDRNLDVEPGTPAFRKLSGLIREAMIQRERNLVARFASTPGLMNPRFANSSVATVPPKPSVTLSELLTRFRRDQRPVRSSKTTSRHAAQDKLFRQIVGTDKPIDAITREDARRLQDWLKSQRLAPATMNFYMAAFVAVMEYALAEGLITANPAKRLQWAMSKLLCIRISVSIETPNDFSIRIAMSGERDARSFKKVERAALVMPSTFAASVTDNPSGSMISVFTNPPGWAGFFMRTSCAIDSTS